MREPWGAGHQRNHAPYDIGRGYVARNHPPRLVWQNHRFVAQIGEPRRLDTAEIMHPLHRFQQSPALLQRRESILDRRKQSRPMREMAPQGCERAGAATKPVDVLQQRPSVYIDVVRRQQCPEYRPDGAAVSSTAAASGTTTKAESAIMFIPFERL